MSRIQLLDEALLDQTTQRALASPRLRANFNFHPNDAANPHRFLNGLSRGTYCAPHRHLHPPKSESFLALRGEIAFFCFADDGQLQETHVLGRHGLIGIDVEAGVWHSIAVLSATAVCYEVKPGPWDPATDKEFAPWAPREGDPRASGYLEGLLALRAARDHL